MPDRPDAATATTEAVHRPVADAAAIATWRGQIDALDTAIVRLVAERAQLSRRIQDARLDAGGSRVELGREHAVLNRYRSRLGSAGSALGEAVLRVCRGAT